MSIGVIEIVLLILVAVLAAVVSYHHAQIRALNTARGADNDDKGSERRNAEEETALYRRAREIVIKAGKASPSYLQRQLRVGYADASRLMDMLEDNGVVSPADGSKPHRLLIDLDDNI